MQFQAPPDWIAAARDRLNLHLADPTAAGTLPRALTDSLKHDLGLSDHQLISALLPLAREYARPPLSAFRVGAVALGASGTIYFGANLEVPTALNQSVHAEQAAVANAFSHDDTGIDAIAVTAAPCGHCRQFLNEIRGADRIDILVSGEPTRRLADLLPSSFGPADLGMQGGLFSGSGDPGTGSRKRGTGSREPGAGNVEEDPDPLIAAAMAGAVRSYAPHSKARSGCAVALKDGSVISGSYLENAAFNPSLGPLHAVLVGMSMRRRPYDAIARVVLVEEPGASISQLETAQMVLNAFTLPVKVERVTRRL